ncbi:hypothetical protein BGZ60DRAFT_393745 [Tricladium varicosporioides]|nr:hypothetical protein BGZ60DRAFT_393745 [Hymenoscyphus varicosporioides]
MLPGQSNVGRDTRTINYFHLSILSAFLAWRAWHYRAPHQIPHSLCFFCCSRRCCAISVGIVIRFRPRIHCETRLWSAQCSRQCGKVLFDGGLWDHGRRKVRFVPVLPPAYFNHSVSSATFVVGDGWSQSRRSPLGVAQAQELLRFIQSNIRFV